MKTLKFAFEINRPLGVERAGSQFYVPTRLETLLKHQGAWFKIGKLVTSSLVVYDQNYVIVSDTIRSGNQGPILYWCWSRFFFLKPTRFFFQILDSPFEMWF